MILWLYLCSFVHFGKNLKTCVDIHQTERIFKTVNTNNIHIIFMIREAKEFRGVLFLA